MDEWLRRRLVIARKRVQARPGCRSAAESPDERAVGRGWWGLRTDVANDDQLEGTDEGSAYSFFQEYCATILSMIWRTRERSSAARAKLPAGIQQGSRWQSMKSRAIVDAQSAQTRGAHKLGEQVAPG